MPSIDVQMIPSKVVYFFFYASIGCICPFIPVFLRSNGLTVRETGLTLGLGSVAGTLFPMIFGWIADSMKPKRILFGLIFLGYGAFSFSLPFVAYIVKYNSSEAKHNDSSAPYTFNATNGTNDSAFSLPYNSEFKSILFFALMVTTVLGIGLTVSGYGVIDSMVSNVIQHSGTTENYGQQVMFSALGLCLGSVISNAVSESFPHLIFSSYMGNFYTFIPCLLAVLPTMNLVYLQTSWCDTSTTENVALNSTSAAAETTPEESIPDGPSKRTQFLCVIKNPDNIVVMITLVICGLLRAISISFIYVFMREEMGASKMDIGLAEGFRCLTLFLILLFSNVLIRTFHGPQVCMCIGVAAYCISLLVISFIRTPWIAVFLQAVRGCAFGIIRPSMVKHTAEVSPKEIYNILFQLNACLIIGIPNVVGNFAGGWLYYQFKGAILFQGTCVLGCVWLLFMGVYIVMRGRVIDNAVNSQPASERTLEM